ncbi:hypothetical protein [Terribacillus sp. JSM ZJ617]|uniref:hypothetical protein n=1 Tax=Terribacillus sp. JSM ZJ617 TaxID=3342119 RepID=UPI0035A8665A
MKYITLVNYPYGQEKWGWNLYRPIILGGNWLKIDGLDSFREAMEDRSNDLLKAEMELWLEGGGFEFLDIIKMKS